MHKWNVVWGERNTKIAEGNEMPKSSDTSSLAVGQLKEGIEGKGREGSAADRELPQFD